MRDRFYSKIQSNSKGCFEWQSSVANHGYGVFRLNGKKELAHRVAWELQNGKIPRGKCVLHKCDNRICVNTDHLFLGTRSDNSADKVSKGRHARGLGHGMVKYDLDFIKQLRKMHKQGKYTYKKLVEVLGVSSSHAWGIVNNRYRRNG